jgi:hypothetical protein
MSFRFFDRSGLRVNLSQSGARVKMATGPFSPRKQQPLTIICQLL